MKAMDSHIYLAWNNPGPINTFHSAACGFSGGVKTMEELVDMPVIVGEWSLATDNCAMWLNGFNDNLPGYPKLPCKFVECPLDVLMRYVWRAKSRVQELPAHAQLGWLTPTL